MHLQRFGHFEDAQAAVQYPPRSSVSRFSFGFSRCNENARQSTRAWNYFSNLPRRLVSSKTSGFLNRRGTFTLRGRPCAPSDHVISCTSARARISETQLPKPYSVSFLKRSVYYLSLSISLSLSLSLALCGFSNSPCFPLFRPRFSTLRRGRNSPRI